MPDIDIDFADRKKILEKLKHRVAKLGTGGNCIRGNAI